MKVNLQETIFFPFQDKNWISKILIGGLFFLAGIFIVPLLFPVGYLAKVMRDAISKEKPSLPEWKDWENLLRDGFNLFLIAAIYVIPIMMVFSIFGTICCFVFGLIPYLGTPMIMLSVMGMGLLYSLVIMPVIVISMCLFLCTDEFSSAFQIQKALEIYKKGITEYIIISIIALTLSAISVILFFLLPFTGFYIKIITCRMYSEAFIKYAEEAEESSLLSSN